MIRMRKLIFLMVFFVTVDLVYAQGISLNNYRIKVELLPSGLAKEEIALDLTNTGGDIDHITYSLNQEPLNVVAYDESGSLQYSVEKDEEYHIIIKKDVKSGEKTSINIEFDSKGLVEQTEKKYIFSFDYMPPKEIDSFQVELKLPQGFVLSDIAQSVSPKPSETTSDGKSIILKWDYQDWDEELTIIAVYERGYTQQLPNYLVYSVLGVIIIGLVAVVLFYKREKMDVAMMVLTDEEKTIVNKILDQGEIKQKKLVKMTGFSKSKMSKILRRLEERGIVEKIPWGNTNILKVTKKLRR